MAPRAPKDLHTPDFMKIGFFENVFMWIAAVIAVVSFLGMMLGFVIMYLITGVRIDPKHWDLDQFIATGKIRGK